MVGRQVEHRLPQAGRRVVEIGEPGVLGKLESGEGDQVAALIDQERVSLPVVLHLLDQVADGVVDMLAPRWCDRHLDALLQRDVPQVRPVGGQIDRLDPLGQPGVGRFDEERVVRAGRGGHHEAAVGALGGLSDAYHDVLDLIVTRASR